MPNVLYDALFARHCDTGRPFLIPAAGPVISYADFLATSRRLANVLTKAGVSPGDRVAVQVEKSPVALALYAACIQTGAIFLPLNPAYTAAEVGYFIEDAEPRLIVCDPAAKDVIAPLAENVGSTVMTLNGHGRGSLADAARKDDPTFAPANRSAADIAAILYTSGTTGRPKGAMLTHANLLSNAQVLTAYWRFTDEDILLHALPIFHTHGLFTATNVTLVAGGAMIFLPRFDTNSVVDWLPRATTMMGVPTFYTRLLSNRAFARESVAHIRLFISGSAPLLEETHAAFAANTGHQILERYGMTETSMITSNPYDGDRRAGTVGFPLPGNWLRITDPETGRTLPDTEVGSIEVSGPSVFSGYWRQPEMTAAEFREDGYFITGDLGLRDEHGYLHIVGRSKDLIISGGYNIYPKEVERVIDGVSGVSESAVIGVPHDDFGEAVVGVVVRYNQSLDETAILEAMSGALARFKHPKRLMFVDDLPRNAMGKVQKNILRDMHRTLFT